MNARAIVVFTSTAVLGLAWALAHASARAQTPPPSRVFTTPYVCDDARVVGITHSVARIANAPLTITFGVEAKVVHVAESASGLRYVDDANTWQWWGQGDTSTLTDLERNEPIAQNCRPYGAPKHMTRPAPPSRALSQ